MNSQNNLFRFFQVYNFIIICQLLNIQCCKVVNEDAKISEVKGCSFSPIIQRSIEEFQLSNGSIDFRNKPNSRTRLKSGLYNVTNGCWGKGNSSGKI